jgi:intein/homing endonuclease
VKHNKGTLRITDGHPVYVDGKGWCAIDSVKATDIHKTPSQDLLVGDMLKTALGSSEIKSIEKQEEQDVYNINRVADNHNFYAGQVLVHNVELK